MDIYTVCLRGYVVSWVWILLGDMCRNDDLDMGMDKMVCGCCYGYGFRGLFMD